MAACPDAAAAARDAFPLAAEETWKKKILQRRARKGHH